MKRVRTTEVTEEMLYDAVMDLCKKVKDLKAYLEARR
jgi:hypothetical protein